jgi:hypothetical protein
MPSNSAQQLRTFPANLRRIADAAFSAVEEPRIPGENLLYHYTGAEGLYGIASSKSLRATDFRYLNDTREVTYAYDLMHQVAEQNYWEAGYGSGEGDDRDPSPHGRFLESIRWSFRRALDKDVYVSSFSRQETF